MNIVQGNSEYGNNSIGLPTIHERPSEWVQNTSMASANMGLSKGPNGTPPKATFHGISPGLKTSNDSEMPGVIEVPSYNEKDPSSKY